MDYLTAQQAAEKLGCAKCTVTRWAAELGIDRRLGDGPEAALMLTAAEVAAIGKAKRQTRGNPNGWKATNAQKRQKTRKNTGKTGRKKSSGKSKK